MLILKYTSYVHITSWLHLLTEYYFATEISSYILETLLDKINIHYVKMST